VKKNFKLSNLIPLLLVVYIAKSFIMGPSFFDFGVITLMSMSFAYKLKLDKDVLTDKDELKSIIAQLEEKVNSNYHELHKSSDNHRLELENKISTLNLGLQRSVNAKEGREKTAYGWGNR
jgi:hypothetical protein